MATTTVLYFCTKRRP